LKKINKSQSLIFRLTALSSRRSTGSKCEGEEVFWVGYQIAPWKSCWEYLIEPDELYSGELYAISKTLMLLGTFAHEFL